MGHTMKTNGTKEKGRFFTEPLIMMRADILARRENNQRN